LVLFAHGSGSSRHSPRNKFVAEELRSGGVGTLLFDLLTQEEEKIDIRTRELRFDIDLLARRLVGATDWVLENPPTKNYNLGYFGSSTGAAAALIGAAKRPDVIKTVVSRGGRPDLAKGSLLKVSVPTLFIVGERDYQVINLNRQAMDRMIAAEDVAFELVPHATHLFEEPGALEEVARLAKEWFREKLE
jgi:pimeloyl-ACP methyl ester carboxylesterase